MLTDKLLQRFEKCLTIEQKADLAYCLTLLKVSEKSIKTLAESFKAYKDALYDEDVYKAFCSIVTKAKKTLKPEHRQFIEEWEVKLNEMAAAGAENEQADAQAGKDLVRARKRVARKVGKLASKDNHQQSDEKATKTPGKAKPTPRRTRRAVAKTKPVPVSSDEEDMEFHSDSSIEKENTSRLKIVRARQPRRVIADSDSEKSLGDD